MKVLRGPGSNLIGSSGDTLRQRGQLDDEARAAGAEAMRRALPCVLELLARQSRSMAVVGIRGNTENRLVS